jgi:hypothetical protein
MREAWRLAAIAVALCGWVDCARASGVAAGNPPREATVASPVARRGDAAAASPQWVTTRVWVAGCSAPDDLWKYRKGSSTVTCDPRGRTLASTTGKLVWPDYLNASDVDTIILEGDGLETLRFELAWSQDDTFAPQNSVRQAIDPADSSAIRFTLKGVPGWQGLVRRFRLTWRGEPSHTSRIVAAWGKKGTDAEAADSTREKSHDEK